MSIKTLMSAAHAAGFAMAAEDAAELPPVMQPKQDRSVVPDRAPQTLPAIIPGPTPTPIEIIRLQRAVRRFWVRMWLASAWGGRATA